MERIKKLAEAHASKFTLTDSTANTIYALGLKSGYETAYVQAYCDIMQILSEEATHIDNIDDYRRISERMQKLL